jgi:lysophospholipase L1-like esterase
MEMEERIMRRKHALIVAFGIFFGTSSLRASALVTPPQRHWLGTWAAAPQAASSFPSDFPSGFEGQTVRQIVRVSVGGSAVRIRLTNAFGDRPVRFDSLHVGIQREGAELLPGSNHRLFFGGDPFVSLAVGASAWSDPVPLAIPALGSVAVSFFLSGPTGPPTMHLNSNQVNFVTEGDVTADESGGAFPEANAANWYYIEEVDVFASPSVKGAVVTLGDSLTDGLGSAWDANTRYPDFLAQRLLAGPPGRVLSVLNEGMTGNRILGDSPCFGPNVQARLDRDVLAKRGVVAVLFQQGIDDLGFSLLTPETLAGIPFECFQPNPDVSSDELIAGIRRIIVRVHAAGLPIFGATMNPIKDSYFWSPETEVKREAVNAWIRQGGEFDGVVDFAAAVADPNDRQALAPQYDSGDRLHPNDAGYEAMARAVRLSLFR